MLSRFPPSLTWAVLSFPALLMPGRLVGGDGSASRAIPHGSGEWATRLMIIVMVATALMMLCKGWRGPRCLVKNRRYLACRRSAMPRSTSRPISGSSL